MLREIGEADWKLFRQLHALALERFCEGVLSEVGRLASVSGKSAHERYLAVFKRLQRRDKELAECRGQATPTHAAHRLLGCLGESGDGCVPATGGEVMWKSLKRWPVLLALLVVIGGLAVGLVCLPSGDRVTWANCERIKEGMTESEVRAILGKPWDNSLLDPEPPGDPDLLWSSEPKATRRCLWVGSNFIMLVQFDRDGQVESTELVGLDLPHSSLPGRVWRRLRARYGW